MTAKMIEELAVPECQRLLDDHHFGRLAFIDLAEGVPMIIPVNYVTRGGIVVFRTDRGAKLTAAFGGAPWRSKWTAYKSKSESAGVSLS